MINVVYFIFKKKTWNNIQICLKKKSSMKKFGAQPYFDVKKHKKYYPFHFIIILYSPTYNHSFRAIILQLFFNVIFKHLLFHKYLLFIQGLLQLIAVNNTGKKLN